MIKVSDVINQVRPLVSDEIKPFRYSSDPDMIRYMTEGQREIVRRQPEAMYVTEVTTTDPVDITGTAQTLDIQDKYLLPLVDYVAWRILARDAENTVNMQLAIQYRTQFAQELN